jgi:hypothetical protein
MRLASLFFISLVVAIAGLVQPAFFPWPDSIVAMHLRTFGPAALWLMLLVAAVIAYGRRGLWLLLGAPLGLLGPFVWINFYLACELQIFRGSAPINCP